MPVKDPGFANGGGNVVRLRRDNRGAMVVGVWGGCPPPHLGWGSAPPQKNFLILDLKCRLLVHSERYFLQFSYRYLLYMQKHCFWAQKTCCMQTDSKRRQSKSVGNYTSNPSRGIYTCSVVLHVLYVLFCMHGY